MEGKARVSSRALAVVCALSLGAMLAGPPSAAQAEDGPRVELGVCDLMVNFIYDSGDRLQRYLPEGYVTGTNLFTAGRSELTKLMYWVYDCDAVEVPGRSPQRARVAFTTIAINVPEREAEITTTPRNYDMYTFHTHTDNAEVATWLSADGIPAEVVPIKIHRNERVIVQVAGDRGYTITARPLHPDVIGNVHSHNNTFWHDDERGTAGRLRYTVFDVTDTACYVPCGWVEATPGSQAAELLGGTSRPLNVVADHVALPGGGFELSRR